MRKVSRTVKKLRKPSKKTLKFFGKIVRKINPRKKTRRRKKVVIRKSIFSAPTHPAFFELPQVYGENKLVLLVRDPWWLFAYWELTSDREGSVLEAIVRRGLVADRRVLRVYDVTSMNLPSAHSFFDIEFRSANSWYIDIGVSNRRWVAEIGWLSRDGQFFALVRSNVVRTPRHGVSDVIDEEWMLPDELSKKLYHLAGAGKSFSSFEAHSEAIR